jgi:antitoxin (DNA-binding transcriptional repressor) of toxin-antitoxin stability system
MDRILQQLSAPKRGEFVSVSIHQFKNNISRYIRALEDGRHKAVIVHRNDRPVGVFIPYAPPPAGRG